jgi:two-component system response regulator AtoC
MKPPSLLIIDDEPLMRLSVMDALKAVGYDVRAASTGQEGLDLLRKEPFDVVISDLRLPGASGLELLQSCKQLSPKTEVILITAHGSVETAVEAMKVGAYDYITKPFSMEELLLIVERVIKVLASRQESRRDEIEAKFAFQGIVGNNEQMRKVLDRIKSVACTNSCVLIIGEKGTGKDLIANAIHRNSARRDRAFIKVSCGAVPPSELETELFGQAKGGALGSGRLRRGRFEMAQKGTLFLADISSLPLSIQIKLTRMLREGRVERTGGGESLDVDVRILCASERDVDVEVREGRFSEELLSLLRDVTLVLPPLRERGDDIMILAEAMLGEESSRVAKTLKGFSEGARGLLRRHSFPGNVRELEQMMRQAVASARPQEEIQPWDLCGFVSCPFLGGPPNLDCEFCREGITTAKEKNGAAGTLSEAREEFERQFILNALDRARGSRTEAARLLGLSRKALWEKCKRYGISPAGLDPENE